MLANEKGENSDKRKSVISIVDAKQTNNSVSYLDTNSVSGHKESNSFFKKESIGYTEYETRGVIDLQEIQFFSLDDLFDRMGFNPDHFDLFKIELQKRMKSFNSEKGYFMMKDSAYNISELGFTFSDEDINFLVKFFLKQIMQISIKRANAYVESYDFQIKYIDNPIKDKFYDEDGWVNLTEEYLDDMVLNIERKYIQSDTKISRIERKQMEITKQDILIDRKNQDIANPKKSDQVKEKLKKEIKKIQSVKSDLEKELEDIKNS
jgi:hypothetical protein